MSRNLLISSKDIVEQIKISCQIPTVVEAIATLKLIEENASKLGIKVEVEELQQAANGLRLANKLFKAEDTWAWLQKYHLSLDDLEKIAYKNLISQKLSMHLLEDKYYKLIN